MFAFIVRLVNKLFFLEKWNIGILKYNGTLLTIDNVWKEECFHWLSARYPIQADPFLYVLDDCIYIFYEAMTFVSAKGEIRCRKLDSNFSEVADISVDFGVDITWHQSFPYLFFHEGKIYMIPESSEASCVSIFKSISFPHKWEKIKDIVSGRKLTDSHVVFNGGLFYLFSTDLNDRLIIHSSDDIYGEWSEINPELNLGNIYSRAAGASFSAGEKIFCVTQESSSSNYGKSIYIKEMVSIDCQRIDEKVVNNLGRLDGVYKHGVHTINSNGEFVVIDAKLRKLSFIAPILKLIYHIKCYVRQRSEGKKEWLR